MQIHSYLVLFRHDETLKLLYTSRFQRIFTFRKDVKTIQKEIQKMCFFDFSVKMASKIVQMGSRWVENGSNMVQNGVKMGMRWVLGGSRPDFGLQLGTKIRTTQCFSAFGWVSARFPATTWSQIQRKIEKMWVRKGYRNSHRFRIVFLRILASKFKENRLIF